VTDPGGAARGRDHVPFAQLPVHPGGPLRHAWDYFGRDDELGTLNFLGEPERLSALGEVRSGSTFRLDLPPGEPTPALYGRQVMDHRLYQVDRNEWDERVDSFYPQASSQWDGLRHIRFREHGFYTGVTRDPDRHSRLGIEHWARRGVIGRGVLVDVAGYLERQGVTNAGAEYRITAELLEQVCAEHGIAVRRGDILCIRTGWMRGYRDLSLSPQRDAYVQNQSFAGLSPEDAVVEFLWDHQVAAVAADNPAVECSPGDASLGSLHRKLIPMLGFAIGELFDFEQLAVWSAAEGRSTFLFVSVPLYLVGGVGSTANAIAVV